MKYLIFGAISMFHVSCKRYCLLLWWLTLTPCFADGVQVTDYLARVVSLDKPAKRIVALAPHIVENIYSAGAGEKIVGVVEYCDYPESAKEISRVGAISAYSIESIVALKPDLVVVWYSGRGGKVLDKLVQLGLTVYADDPKNLEDVSRSVHDFGILAGTQSTASLAASDFIRQKTLLETENKNKSVVSVFYQVWNDPLQTLNGKHIISDVIRLCGGRNVFADSIAIAPKISIESVIQQNPEVIIASGMGELRPDWLNEWQRWQNISAVKSKNLYFIPPDLIQRHTIRMLEGAKLMCEKLDGARRSL